jgi:hypothetical protein
MKTSKNILIYNYIDISIIKFLVLSNFNKSFFILSFLLALFGFSKTSNIYFIQYTDFTGLKQFYLKERETISIETLQIKNINSSGKFIVHSSTLLFLLTELDKCRFLFIKKQQNLQFIKD